MNENKFKTYDDYMKWANSPENIIKAGGIKQHRKAINKFKRHQRMLGIKRIIQSLPFTLLRYIPRGIILFLVYILWLSRYDFMSNIPIALVLFIGFVLFVMVDEIRYKNYLKK